MKCFLTLPAPEDEVLLFDRGSFVNTIYGFMETEYSIGRLTSKRPVIIRGIDRFYFKSDSINCSLVKLIRLPILFGFALDKQLGHKMFMKHRTKPRKIKNETAWIYSMF